MFKCIYYNWLSESVSADEVGKVFSQGVWDGVELSVDFCFEGMDIELLAVRVETMTRPLVREGFGFISLTTCRYDLFSLASVDEVVRGRALAGFGFLLELAHRLGVGQQVVILAHQQSELGESLDGGYEGAFNGLFSALGELAAKAECLSVRLLIENPGSSLLLSPLELRELLDEINNPFFGLSFNPGYAACLGDAEDWLRIMGPRVAAVRLVRDGGRFGEVEDASERVVEALRAIDFDGVVVYSGR